MKKSNQLNNSIVKIQKKETFQEFEFVHMIKLQKERAAKINDITKNILLSKLFLAEKNTHKPRAIDIIKAGK